MTEIVKKVIEATMELTLRPQKNDRAKVISTALREVVNQLQYYNFGDGEDMVVSARALYELADELEVL